ncbi:hypothetical protein L7F22_028283 [Adiantum nelumboides]|nr:hypothetical protein [Adiantum nelumboides]
MASSTTNRGGGGRPFRTSTAAFSTEPPSIAPSPINNNAYFRRMSRGDSSDMDAASEVSSVLNVGYTVVIPPTPDNQPMMGTMQDIHIHKAEQQMVTNSIFTGGFNNMTVSHVLDKMTDGPAGSGDPSSGHGRRCAMHGCDGNVIRNERGEDLYPCECNFKICRDCYADVCKAGGRCRGCKEPYKPSDEDQDPYMPLSGSAAGSGVSSGLSLPAPEPQPLERRLSIVKSKKHSQQLLMRNQSHANHGDGGGGAQFDHAHWLYETKGTYGFGNAVWPKESESYEAGFDMVAGASLPDFKDRARRPLARKIKVPAGILSPYRLLVVVRFVVLGMFLSWRVSHPNTDAIWLWGMSIVCEIWFAFSWILDQLPKLCPINRAADLTVLKEKFEQATPDNPSGRSDLPGIDVFVSTADPEKEPPLVTANTILSILATEYPVDKLACYLSDDGGALLTFEATAEAASYARIWIPFCRKHNIEPRNPESYFNLKGDPTKNKVRQDFVKDRRRVKREYDEFKVRINSLPDCIRRRSDAYNAHEEVKARRNQMENGVDSNEPLKILKATWMADGTHWPGTWSTPSSEHSKGDHAGIIQVMLAPPSYDPVFGSPDEENLIDSSEVDIRLPMLVYVSREKRPGYDHNKKAGAMNALVRSSAIMSNAPFILNLDCDHYIYNSLAFREGICFMMDRGGENICYVQFPQRFEGIDTNDRYANHNTVFFDGNMRALDGLQGPMYVGTGCMFRRIALYAFDPPRFKEHGGFCSWLCCCCCRGSSRRRRKQVHSNAKKMELDSASMMEEDDEDQEMQLVPKKFGGSTTFLMSIPKAEYQGKPLADHPGVKFGRPPGALTAPRERLDPATIAEAISVISCWYEDKTEWGGSVGWIYGSVTEDVVTGYRMHNRGWRSVYCVTKRDAFRGTAPINLTDRLQQVLRWATGSVEIFFSRNNGLLAGSRMKILQRIAYLNVGIYPFTSIFLMVYCFLPALSLFTDQFIVQTLDVFFLIYLLIITLTLCMLAVLEVKWAGITLEEWWRNEQFWVIGGTSAHIAAVLQGLLKVVAGIDISFTLTSKSAGEGEDDEFADLYVVKWTSLMIPPLTIMMVNLIAIAVAAARTIYSSNPSWSKLLGGLFFSLWVLMHLYPFAKGLMGRRGRTPTIIWVWSGLISITISLLWVAISNPQAQLSTGFLL